MESTQSCAGRTIFFSQLIHKAIIRSRFIAPVSEFTIISLPMLLVANLVSQFMLQNSINLGKNAESLIEGIQSSKKLVRTIGVLTEATGIFAEAVKVTLLSLNP